VSFKELLKRIHHCEIPEKRLAQIRWPRICATCRNFNHEHMTFEAVIDTRGRVAPVKEKWCINGQRHVEPNDACHFQSRDERFCCMNSPWEFFVPLMNNYEEYLRRGGVDFRADHILQPQKKKGESS